MNNFFRIWLMTAPFWIFISCNSNKYDEKDAFNIRKEIKISIQPFEGISKNDIQYIAKRLKGDYPNIQINNPINFPQNSLNKAKTRYRADSLIRFLSRQTKENQFTIGLTTKDISTTSGKKLDWGIMGLGFCPGKSCIVSSFRLKGKNKLEKLFKVAIHELGHTQGLPHCPIKNCLMRDAEGKDNLNNLKDFCLECKSSLIKKGWIL